MKIFFMFLVIAILIPAIVLFFDEDDAEETTIFVERTPNYQSDDYKVTEQDRIVTEGSRSTSNEITTTTAEDFEAQMKRECIELGLDC